jgi:hypothetical protein
MEKIIYAKKSNFNISITHLLVDIPVNKNLITISYSIIFIFTTE